MKTAHGFKKCSWFQQKNVRVFKNCSQLKMNFYKMFKTFKNCSPILINVLKIQKLLADSQKKS